MEHGYSLSDLDLTYLVLRGGQAFAKTDASLQLLGALRPPWSYLRVLRFVPKPLRNWVYDAVARNRLKWFGERPDCYLPTAAQRHKFLDEIPNLAEATTRAE